MDWEAQGSRPKAGGDRSASAIDMAPDDAPRTAQRRITEVGRIPGDDPRRRGPGGAAVQARYRDGSRNPEVVAGAGQLPDATALDGELRDAAGRLAFERLQNRLARRGAGTVRAAEQWPAYFDAFDLLRLSGTDATGWAYRQRRAQLESVFAARRLVAPWVLCPSTTDPELVREWLTWTSVGMEGMVLKKLHDVYRPSVRGRQKYKVRETSEAVVGAVTGSPASPHRLLLGRYYTDGHPRTASPRIHIAPRCSLAAQARAVTASRRSRWIASPWLTRTGRSAARSWNRPPTIELRTLLVTAGRNGHADGPQLAVAYTMRLSTGCPCASKSPSHVMSRRARSWVGP
ncbi:ATP-dependent DNA ligase [Streptomyces tauricus]